MPTSPKQLLAEVIETAKSYQVLVGLLANVGLNSVLMFTLVPSSIMCGFMGVSAFIGSFLAVVKTAHTWYAVGKEKRGRWWTIDLLICGAVLAGIFFTLWVLNMETAKSYESAADVREWLMIIPWRANLLMAFFSGIFSYFFTAASVILSPSLERKSSGKKDE